MNDDFKIGMALAIMGTIGLLIGAAILQNNMQDKAAETECAQYHPVTGDFEWLP